MSYTVFYSWQSDLPNGTNRGFIMEALEKAAGIVAKDETVEVSPFVDRDTQGVPGSPEIGATIFTKIDNAQAFVCDVSIINNGTAARQTPNPNVMLELGYAAKSLGWDNIVMVMNTAYSRIDNLPFDLRTRRIVPYQASEGEADRSPEKKKLVSTFEAALRAMVHHAAPAAAAGGVEIKPRGLAEIAIEAVEEARPNQVLQVRRYMSSVVGRLIEIAPDWSQEEERDDLLVQSIDASLPTVIEFGKVTGVVAAIKSSEAASEIFRGFEAILERYDRPRDFAGNYDLTNFDFFRFIGHELFVMFVGSLVREKHWQILAEILDGSLRPNNIRVTRERPPATFEDLSYYVELFLKRNLRLNLNRLSVRADILSERHSTGELGNESSLREFTEADFFLFLRGEMHNNPGQDRIDWIPWSVLYMESIPNFLYEAERKANAQKILPALGAESVEQLQSVLDHRVSRIGQLYQGGFWSNPLRNFDSKKLASY